MSFNGQISGSLAPQGTKAGNLSGNIGAVVPDIRDESVTTAKLADEAVTTTKIADAAVTIAKLAQDVTALINSKGDASDVATLQSDVAALQTITAGLGTASTYGVANNLTTAAAGTDVLDAYQGKLLGDRVTTAEGNITTLNDGYAQLNNALDGGSKRPFFRRVNYSNSLTCNVNTGGNGVGLLIAGTGTSASIWVMRYRPAESAFFIEKIGGALSTTFSGTCTTEGVITITASANSTFAVWMT